MAKVDRKGKSANAGEKHSLSSFEKKRGARIAFNAQARTKKKYRVVNVQKENRDISPTGKINHGERSVNISEKNAAKPVKNMAGRAFASGQATNLRNKSHTPDNAQKPENAVSEHIGISPETAQRMKRAAFLDQQNKANIKINTARADFSESERSPENTSDKNTVSASNDSGDKKPYEHKYVSQTSDSFIPEQKKAISPEMALRMKRAAFIEQKNNEAIRLNRAAVVKDEDIPQADEKDGQSETVPDVPVEHLKDEQGKAYENEYLGNSEHAVFDTFDADVRAYKAQNAYGKYIGKQRGKALDNIVGGVGGESAKNVISDVSKVGQAVSRSDSVSGSVLDVSSALAAVEAKKLVKKLAETDLKKERRAEERMRNHGNRFGIDKYDEVTGKNEKSKNRKADADRKSEAPDKKQGGSKVGNSHKLQQEKQEYGKKQRAKEVKGKQKEIFIKENKKIPDTLFSGTVGKASLAKQLLKKKGASVILGGGGLTVVLPVLITIVVFVIIMGFFGWLTPFSYGLAGEEPDEEHNAETNAEIIDGYTLMVKNYMDITQAYYYLNYGDWYGGTYQYENAGLDFGAFFAEYCQKIIKEIQAQFQPLINQAKTPEEAQAISQAMGRAISQALSQAQQAAYEEYMRLIGELNDGLTPSEHRQHYEVEISNGGNGIEDSVEFNGKPIVGTNGFGNVEINSELSSEELLSYIALYKSLVTMKPDDSNADPDAEESEPSLNITPQDIMDFFEKTEYISITAEITHNNPCIGQNCKRRLTGDYESGYSWEYYCDSDHDNLTGEIGECLSADELLKKVMELTEAENIGVDEKNCKKILESYIDMFKKELDIDESGSRQFGAKDNAKAMEFYEKLIKDELPNSGLWQVNTPFTEG